ncbi:MAG: hypothetical protein H6529_04290 [Nocardioides sp.]|nr:hypothetical protein [Nocardioidaceae bacterium]MCB8955679.1 hypothetical protein [Nocardioides sp.]
MLLWIIIVAVVVIALGVFAFWPRKSNAYSDRSVRDAKGQGNADLYDGRPPY